MQPSFVENLNFFITKRSLLTPRWAIVLYCSAKLFRGLGFADIEDKSSRRIVCQPVQTLYFRRVWLRVGGTLAVITTSQPKNVFLQERRNWQMQGTLSRPVCLRETRQILAAKNRLLAKHCCQQMAFQTNLTSPQRSKDIQFSRLPVYVPCQSVQRIFNVTCFSRGFPEPIKPIFDSHSPFSM